MDCFDSLKNIQDTLTNISTEKLLSLNQLVEHELYLRKVEDIEGIDERYVNKHGVNCINYELLVRKEKKQHRDALKAFNENKQLTIARQRDEYQKFVDWKIQTEQALDAEDQMIVLEPEKDGLTKFVKFIYKPDVRRQKNIKPIYKSYRLKTQKRLDKEKRAKRKPASLFI
jgi:hypothetical protein